MRGMLLTRKQLLRTRICRRIIEHTEEEEPQRSTGTVGEITPRHQHHFWKFEPRLAARFQLAYLTRVENTTEVFIISAEKILQGTIECNVDCTDYKWSRNNASVRQHITTYHVDG
jgi:hypothetical protein